jgi:hypothetical protein
MTCAQVTLTPVMRKAVLVGRKSGKVRCAVPYRQYRNPWMNSSRPTVATMMVAVRADTSERASRSMTIPARGPNTPTDTSAATGHHQPMLMCKVKNR